VYDSEQVELLTFDVPHDDEVQNDIISRATAFMAIVRIREPNQLEKMLPPVEDAPPLPSSTDYVPVTGQAWEVLARDFLSARASAEVAKAQADRWKGVLEDAMIAAKLDKVRLPDGSKVSYTLGAGRATLDKRALQLAHPEVKLSDFETRGKPSRSLRVYPAKED